MYGPGRAGRWTLPLTAEPAAVLLLAACAVGRLVTGSPITGDVLGLYAEVYGSLPETEAEAAAPQAPPKRPSGTTVARASRLNRLSDFPGFTASRQPVLTLSV